jgi:hypothetical protein
VPVLADDDVVVHGNAERGRDVVVTRRGPVPVRSRTLNRRLITSPMGHEPISHRGSDRGVESDRVSISESDYDTFVKYIVFDRVLVRVAPALDEV